jgi:DNA-binding CsgD family transcriptional regulator
MDDLFPELSNKEREYVSMLSWGLSTQVIADISGRSRLTVKDGITRARQKLGNISTESLRLIVLIRVQSYIATHLVNTSFLEASKPLEIRVKSGGKS